MPAKKAEFKVVYVSTENDKYPSSDLNSDRHGPLVQGWQSEKFCLYPIELIVQFSKKIRLKKVQLLSHQYLIASKIEFFIGDLPDDTPPFSLREPPITRHNNNNKKLSNDENEDGDGGTGGDEEQQHQTNEKSNLEDESQNLGAQHDMNDDNYSKNEESQAFLHAKYTRLGYVELSSNERTGFKARELKSVHVDAEGSFLKLILHKNYVNKLNQYNQVIYILFIFI
jgi:hypothetical protein